MILIFLTNLLFAQNFTCKDLKKFPVIIPGCQNEGCAELAYNKAIKSVTVFEIPSRSSKVIGVIKRCEKLEQFEPHTVILRLGRGKLTYVTEEDKEKGLKLGDQVDVVFSEGDGYFKICHKDEMLPMAITDTQDLSVSTFDLVKEIGSGTWIKIKHKNGRTGFAPSEPFYMSFGDFDVSQVCPEDSPLGPSVADFKTKVGQDLSKAYEQFCPSLRKCILKQSIDDKCTIDSQVWAPVALQLPSTLKCSDFFSAQDVCIAQWKGGFSCSAKVNEAERSFTFNFDCQRSSKVDCKVQ
jgi:hypothetical protein